MSTTNPSFSTSYGVALIPGSNTVAAAVPILPRAAPTTASLPPPSHAGQASTGHAVEVRPPRSTSSNGPPKKRGKYLSKWDDTQWREQLKNYYAAAASEKVTGIKDYITQMLPGEESRRKNFNTKWTQSGLQELLNAEVPVFDRRVTEKLDAYFIAPKKKDPPAAAAAATTSTAVAPPAQKNDRPNATLTTNEEKFIAHVIKLLAGSNNNVTSRQQEAMVRNCVTMDMTELELLCEDEAKEISTQLIIDDSTLRRLNARNGIVASRKVYTADPARMKQAKPEVQEEFMKKQDNECCLLQKYLPRMSVMAIRIQRK
jgi:hypothetical protein